MTSGAAGSGPADDGEPGATARSGTGSGERRAAAAGALLVLAVGLAATGSVQSPFLTPRAAVLLLATGPGLVLLVRRAWARDRAAILAVAFLAAAGISTVLADQPALAFFGRENEATGWLFLAALVAMWAIGSGLRRPAARHALEGALLAVVMTNAAVGMLQYRGAGLGRDNVLLASVDGRSVGLVGNAALFGPLVAVGAYLLVRAAARHGRVSVLTALGAVLIGAAIDASGSRIGIGIALLGLGLAARTDLRRAVAVGVFVIIGFATVSIAVPGSANAAARAGASSATSDVRLDVWGAGVEALGARPLLGWGPNQFLDATSNRMTDAVAASNDRNGSFTDAHDTVVEVGVDTGVLGLGLAVAFVVFAARRARGTLAVAAVLLALPMLLEPWSFVLAPLALLALGAAGPDEDPRRLPRPAVVLAGVLLVVGALAGGRLLLGDAALRDATTDLDPTAARTAIALLPPWAEPELAALRAWSWRAIDTGSASDWSRALAAGARATQLDPANPRVWNALAGLEASRGDTDAARAHYQTALTRDPHNRVARAGLKKLDAAASGP